MIPHVQTKLSRYATPDHQQNQQSAQTQPKKDSEMTMEALDRKAPTQKNDVAEINAANTNLTATVNEDSYMQEED